MQRRLIPLLTAPLLAFFLFVVQPAVADVGPGLYVSERGTDSGDCTDINAPCATIKYALSVAGKNTRIHVEQGTYVFDDPQDILYAMSGAVHVHGGYVQDDQGQWIKGGVAFLTSVPAGYRDFFRMHGFVVIVDAKGDEDQPSPEAQALLQQFRKAQQSSAAEDCTGGTAAGFSCDNVNLVSHTARADFSSTPAVVADIWGFVDLNTRREYVIVGVQNGTAVFDVTDASEPREVGFVGGQAATWRDIKVLQVFDGVSGRWRAYAYVTTDGATDGLVVIDLGRLPHAIDQVSYVSDFQNAHNVYITDTDYATGLPLGNAPPQLIVAGSGLDNGQFRSYSLANPAAPQFTRRVIGAGYMHDASSVRISDARAAQCAGGGPSCNVLLDFNEENVELWDITNESAPALLASVAPYPQTGYVHSGWWSEDRQFVFVHDETDERNFALQTTVRVLDISDLSSPNLVETWTGSLNSVDHNGFVRGNRYYVSNYTGGLTVLDITNPTSLSQVGFFDTYPVNNGTSFSGAWGAYPFLPSGLVAVSDINGGLFMLEDATRDVAAGALAFTEPSFASDEGQVASLSVTRNGGSAGAVSVGYELVHVSTGDSDVQLAAGTLSWGAGQSGARQLQVTLQADAIAEPLEEMQLRLVDPRGGAVLGTRSTASLFIAEPGAATELELDDDNVRTAELGFGKAVLTVQRRGSASGTASIDYAIVGGDATPGNDFSGADNGTLQWADGDGLPKSVVFDIVNDGSSESAEFFDVEFRNVQGATLIGPQTARVTILNGAGVNTVPSVSAGADQQRTAGSNVMLNGSATFDPDGDALTYTWTQEAGPAVALTGGSTVTPSFVAPSVTSATALRFRLTATDTGGLSASATTTVTVVPPQSAGGGGQGGGGGSGSTGLLALLLLGCAAMRRGFQVSRKDFGG